MNETTMQTCSAPYHKFGYDRSYLELCEKYPRFRHTMGEHPESPFPLLPCPFCGGAAQTQFTMFGYGHPSYTVRCRKCAARSLPMSWGVGKIYPVEEMHTVTEQEALEDACRKWNKRTSKN